MRATWSIGALLGVALAALAIPATAAEMVTGSCATTAVPAQDMVELPIALSPVEGEISRVQLQLTVSGDVADLVATLDHGAESAAILTGTTQEPTLGADLLYSDAAMTSVTSLPGGVPLEGMVQPAEPFTVFHGSSGGAWSISLLNLGDDSVVVDSCALAIELQVASVSGAASDARSDPLASTGADSTLFLVLALMLVAAGTTLLIRAPRRGRDHRITALALVLVLSATVPLASTATPSALFALGDSGPVAEPPSGESDSPAAPELPAPSRPDDTESEPGDDLAEGAADDLAVVVEGPTVPEDPGAEPAHPADPPAGEIIPEPETDGVELALSELDVEDEPATGEVIHPHPWGTKPDGRAVIADFPSGLVSVPVADCGNPVREPCRTILTDDPSDDDVAMSPTGMQVAFTRYLPPSADFVGGTFLHVLDMRTGEVRRLTENTYYAHSEQPNIRGDRDPEWSLDEQTIVASDGGRLFSIPAAGGAEATLDGQEGSWCGAGSARVIIDGIQFSRVSPQFGPDGTLYYIRRCDFLNGGFGGEVMALAGRDVTAEVEIASVQAFYDHYHNLKISPDGETLLATRRVDQGLSNEPTHEVVAIDVSTKTVSHSPLESMRYLGVGGFDWADAPAWSPAGTHLLTGALEVVRPDGTEYAEVAGLCRYDGINEQGAWEEGIEYSCPHSIYEVYSGDLQCSPGNCLSGFVLNVVGWEQGRDVVASGSAAGFVSPSLFRKAAPGTHQVQLRGNNATILSVDCDDSDSLATTTGVTLRVEESELVVCEIQIGPLHDRDGDGIEDQWDSCPDDPENWCNDTDRDGTPNDEDPCPLDPSDQCDPDDPNDPDDPDDPDPPACKSYDVTTALHNGGIDWFDSNIYGRVCREGAAGERLTVSGTAASDIRTPSMAWAMELAGLSVEVEDPSPTVFRSGSQATSSVWYDACFQLIPGGALGKFAGKAFAKLLGVIKRFSPDRLVDKAVQLWSDTQRAAVRSLDTLAGGTPYVEALVELLETSLGEVLLALKAALQGDDGLPSSLCLPVWRMNITVSPGTTSVSYSVNTLGPSDWRLVNATNAVG